MKDMAKVEGHDGGRALDLEGSDVRLAGGPPSAPVADDGGEWIRGLAGSLDEDLARAVLEGRLGPEHMPDDPGSDR